ncbi:hypothetical protein MMC30_003508 [Trapelia coarctata]|nr:hypothetical protein [Trapelia coarctata]
MPIVIGNNYPASTPLNPVYGHPYEEIYPVTAPNVHDGANLLAATHAYRAWRQRGTQLRHLPRHERDKIQQVDIESLKEFKRKWEEAGRPNDGPGARHPNGQLFGDMFQVWVEDARRAAEGEEEERERGMPLWRRLFGRRGKKDVGMGIGAGGGGGGGASAVGSGSGSRGGVGLERGECEKTPEIVIYRGKRYVHSEVGVVNGFRFKIGDPNRPGGGGDDMWGSGVVNREVRRTSVKPYWANPQ